jgi:hypothetical protein
MRPIEERANVGSRRQYRAVLAQAGQDGARPGTGAGQFPVHGRTIEGTGQQRRGGRTVTGPRRPAPGGLVR